MKTISKILFLSIIISLAVLSCVKKETEPVSDLQKLRNTNNKTVQMDSAQAINTITQQKIQEVLDLSTIFVRKQKYGNRYCYLFSDRKVFSKTGFSHFQKPLQRTGEP